MPVYTATKMTSALQTSAMTLWPRSARHTSTQSAVNSMFSLVVKLIFSLACSAGWAVGQDAVDLQNLTPPLPKADFTVVVPKSNLPNEEFTYLSLLPNQRMMIVLEDPNAVRVWPRNILTEAYDVDDGLCDLGSLKSYMYLFGNTPISYHFWQVTYHTRAGSDTNTKSLVFIAPPREYHTYRKQEFCFHFRDRKGSGSMFVVVKASQATRGGPASVFLVIGSLLPFLASLSYS